MLARTDPPRRFDGYSGPGISFIGSLALRATMFALFTYAAWAIHGMEATDPARPYVYEVKFLMAACFAALATTIVVVGLVQYKNGTFTD